MVGFKKILILILSLGTLSNGCGMVTHNLIAERARQWFSDSEKPGIVLSSHLDALQGGAPFPVRVMLRVVNDRRTISTSVARITMLARRLIGKFRIRINSHSKAPFPGCSRKIHSRQIPAAMGC